MRRETRTILSALLVAAVGLAEQTPDRTPPPETLTVEAAVDYALQHNPLLKTARLEVDKSADAVSAFRTRRLPSIHWNVIGGQLLTRPNVTFSRGVLGTYPGLGPLPGQDARVDIPRRPAAIVTGAILQPVSQQYRLALGIKALDLERQMEMAKLAERQATVSEQVRKAYYQLVETQSALESVEQSLPLYKETMRLTRVGLRLETVLESQRLKAEAETARVELEASKLRNSIQTQMESLNELMGRPVDTAFRTVDVEQLAGQDTSLEAAVETALIQRPEVRQANLRSRQAGLDVRIKKAEYIPDVSVGVTYGSAFNFQNTLPQNVAIAGVSLDWEVFDWGRKKHEMDAKSHTASQARVAEEALQRRIRVEVGQALRQCADASQRMKVSALVQAAARQGLREQQSALSREAVLVKDVLQAQTALAAADDEQRRSQAAYWSARAELKRVLGER